MYELKSSLSWCEKSYVVTPYIAEFWNTITGLSICISSLILLKENRTNKNTNILLLFVGIGTILFHGTLLYIWQLLDEIPMLLIVNEYNKKLMLILNKKPYNDIYIRYIIYVIICSYFYDPKLQVFLFQFTIMVYILTLIYQSYIFNQLTCSKYNLPENVLTNIKRNNRIGLMILITSMIVWNLDNHMCNYVNKFQLHAVWHILTSIGIYYCEHIINTYIKIYEFRV